MAMTVWVLTHIYGGVFGGVSVFETEQQARELEAKLAADYEVERGEDGEFEWREHEMADVQVQEVMVGVVNEMGV